MQHNVGRTFAHTEVRGYRCLRFADEKTREETTLPLDPRIYVDMLITRSLGGPRGGPDP
jgi:hypothetical protein